MYQNGGMDGLLAQETRRNEVEKLCRKYGVKRLRVFGSCLRSDWDPKSSDFDFLAEFGSPPPGINLFTQLFGFAAELEGSLDRRVDVVDWKAAKKPHFRESVEAEAKEWYAA